MNVEWTDDPHPRNSYWELCITITENGQHVLINFLHGGEG
jgi:ribulose bisphosphate carboxylase small subunit